MKIAVIGVFFFAVFTLNAQETKKACFLGNSYTSFNDLPSQIASLATADGNTLIHDKNTPGGYWLEYHSTNATSLSKISADEWDYVILQEQSQKPSFPWLQFLDETYPYAEILCDSIRSANPCAIPLFYNTWGRETGDPAWDSIDTFHEMNWRLHNAYHHMADEFTGKNAPVGVGFAHVETDGSAVVPFDALYASDGSHPTIFGSYLAACIFYEVIFESSSEGNTYFPAGINVTEATYLQSVANWVVNDVDTVTIDNTIPEPSFTSVSDGLVVTFTNTSVHCFNYSWDFGDGNSSTESDPVHTYAAPAAYDVTLEASYCDGSPTVEFGETQLLSTNEIQEGAPLIYPNPTDGIIRIDVIKPTEYQLTTLEGKVIQKGRLDETNNQLHLDSGVYLLLIEDSVQRIIVR